MMMNDEFKSVINEMRKLMYTEEEFNKTEFNKEEFDYNSELMIILTLFSKDIFYVLHKCICQQFTESKIDNVLLIELREQIIAVLNNCY
jgi:hypothetical protein